MNEERYTPSAAHRRRQVAWLGIDAVLLVSSAAHQGDERHGRVRKGRRCTPAGGASLRGR
jgi:hypothetical protein